MGGGSTSPTGTSPRTRGKLGVDRKIRSKRRNIPAHAGKTVSSAPKSAWKREHPRARGENRTTIGPASTSVGTSPRTRGKRKHRDTDKGNTGNIPAHAGKTPSKFWSSRVAREHPRARGENPGYIANHPDLGGTSPRTRGKRYSCGSSWFGKGNIPAHAGKTSKSD